MTKMSAKTRAEYKRIWREPRFKGYTFKNFMLRYFPRAARNM